MASKTQAEGGGAAYRECSLPPLWQESRTVSLILVVAVAYAIAVTAFVVAYRRRSAWSIVVAGPGRFAVPSPRLYWLAFGLVCAITCVTGLTGLIGGGSISTVLGIAFGVGALVIVNRVLAVANLVEFDASKVVLRSMFGQIDIGWTDLGASLVTQPEVMPFLMHSHLARLSAEHGLDAARTLAVVTTYLRESERRSLIGDTAELARLQAMSAGE
jgi:hypothetical protein